MSELSIHELETEHSELLPEREALSFFGGFNLTVVNQKNTDVAVAIGSRNGGNEAFAASSNTAIVAVG